MPRPPTHPHVVRTARKILGISQKDLAARVGIATVTLQKFENGDSSISRDVAGRIASEMGLDATQVIKNKDPLHPRTFARGKIIEPGDGIRKPVWEIIEVPLTKEYREPYQYTEADMEKEMTLLVSVIREFLSSALKKKSYSWVRGSIYNSLRQINEEFKLVHFGPKRGRPPVKSAKKPKRRSP